MAGRVEERVQSMEEIDAIRKEEKGKGGRNRLYSDEEMVEALKAHRGLVCHAAKQVGCKPGAIYRRAKTSKAVQAAIRSQRAEQVEISEKVIFDAAEAGCLPAAFKVVSTLGKKRGWTERTEHRIGGDDDAPPIRNEFKINAIPIELREKILEALIEQASKKEQHLLEQPVIDKRPLLPAPAEEGDKDG